MVWAFLLLFASSVSISCCLRYATDLLIGRTFEEQIQY